MLEHAGGLVIAPERLVNYMPLYADKESEDGDQFDMGDVESIGLLFDLLGLRTLTIMIGQLIQ